MLLQLIFRLHEEASEAPFDQLSTLISVYYLQFGCIPTCSLGVLIVHLNCLLLLIPLCMRLLLFRVTALVRLNDQMKPITDLLRETENLNLAPEILEPEAQSIEKVWLQY